MNTRKKMDLKEFFFKNQGRYYNKPNQKAWPETRKTHLKTSKSSPRVLKENEKKQGKNHKDIKIKSKGPQGKSKKAGKVQQT